MIWIWNDENPPTPEGDELLHDLYKAHTAAAFRNNPSSQAVALSAQGSGKFHQGIIAALSTIGGPHGSVEDCYDTITRGPKYVEKLLSAKMVVPGWGNSFVKGKHDKDWAEVEEDLIANYPTTFYKLDALTKLLHSKGKDIYPNPGGYTAACAIALGLSREESTYLFIRSRLDAWGAIFNKHKQQLWN